MTFIIRLNFTENINEKSSNSNTDKSFVNNNNRGLQQYTFIQNSRFIWVKSVSRED